MELQDGIRKNDKHQLFTRTCTKPNTSWLMHSWTIFGARMNHGRIRTHKIHKTHKTHHDLDLGEATTFPIIVYSMLGHGTDIQMAFCLGTPEIPKVGTLATLGAHNFP
jgi:hypothetical protein